MWDVKSQQENKINVADMRMLQQMNVIQQERKVEAAPVVEKMIESHLKGFELV